MKISTLRQLNYISEQLDEILTLLSCKDILETFRRNDISADRVLTLTTNDFREMRLAHRWEIIFKTNREIHKQRIQEILER